MQCPSRAGSALPRPVRGRLDQQDPWISTHMIPMTLCGNTGQEHQHRPQLQQEYGPRHAPGQELRPEHHYNPVCSSTGPPDPSGSSDSKALEYQQGLRYLTRPQASTQPQKPWISTQTLATAGQWTQTCLSCSPGLDITLVPDGMQATHISLFLNILAFSDLPLSTGREPFLRHIFAYHSGSYSPGTIRALMTQTGHWVSFTHMSPVLPGVSVDIFSQARL